MLYTFIGGSNSTYSYSQGSRARIFMLPHWHCWFLKYFLGCQIFVFLDFYKPLPKIFPTNNYDSFLANCIFPHRIWDFFLCFLANFCAWMFALNGKCSLSSKSTIKNQLCSSELCPSGSIYWQMRKLLIVSKSTLTCTIGKMELQTMFSNVIKFHQKNYSFAN